MSKRHFVAVYTDSGCIVGCSHNLATAVACVSEPGGYVIARCRRKHRPLTDAEEAEFQKLMYGSEETKKREAPDLGLFIKGKLGTQS
jgi:hypothetical protein